MQMQRSHTHMDMVSHGVIFADIISPISLLTWVPQHSIMATIVDQIVCIDISHFHQPCRVVLHGTIDSAHDGLVVVVEGCLWFCWVA